MRQAGPGHPQRGAGDCREERVRTLVLPEERRNSLALFKRNSIAVGDPEWVEKVVRFMCPNDGDVHVYQTGPSFPTKGFGSFGYRVSRQREWGNMSMDELVTSETALEHPLNLRRFYRAYSPYADVSSNGSPAAHLNVVSWYLLLIRRFLDKLPPDRWTLVCFEHLTEKYTRERDGSACQASLAGIAEFYGYPTDRCDDCFDGWRETRFNNDGAEGRAHDAPEWLRHAGMKINGDNRIVEKVEERMEGLRGIWPLPAGNDWQQCTA